MEHDENEGHTVSTGDSLFKNTVVFHPEDTRSYLFSIEPKDTRFKVDKYESYGLGQLELRWQNYFGDPGLLKIGPFKSVADQRPRNDIDLEVVPEQDRSLNLEEPKQVLFRLHNLSLNNMKISLSTKEVDQGNIQICGISTPNLGQIKPHSHVDFCLELFPKSCGVNSVSGLKVKDS